MAALMSRIQIAGIGVMSLGKVLVPGLTGAARNRKDAGAGPRTWHTLRPPSTRRELWLPPRVDSLEGRPDRYDSGNRAEFRFGVSLPARGTAPEDCDIRPARKSGPPVSGIPDQGGIREVRNATQHTVACTPEEPQEEEARCTKGTLVLYICTVRTPYIPG